MLPGPIMAPITGHLLTMAPTKELLLITELLLTMAPTMELPPFMALFMEQRPTTDPIRLLLFSMHLTLALLRILSQIKAALPI